MHIVYMHIDVISYSPLQCYNQLYQVSLQCVFGCWVCPGVQRDQGQTDFIAKKAAVDYCFITTHQIGPAEGAVRVTGSRE